jgi:hypothetical protein
MSHFIIEYRFDGRYFMETLMGVEDIDLSDKRFADLLGVWECQTTDEVNALHKHLREMRNATRSS